MTDYVGMATLISAVAAAATTIVSAIISLRNGWKLNTVSQKADRNASKADAIAAKVDDIHNQTAGGGNAGAS